MRRLLVPLVLLSAVAADAAADVSARERPRCVAHRGDHREAPENSIAAFAAAVEGGADAVELDVRHTFDGVPVILHDATLERTARAAPGQDCPLTTPVRRLYFAEIQGCELANGEPVPRLVEALDLLQSREPILFLETKDLPTVETLGLVRRYYEGRAEKLRVISFDVRHLEWVRESRLNADFYREVKVYPLGESPLSVPWIYDGVDTFLAPRFLVSILHWLKKDVVVWTYNSPRRIRRAVRRHVDFITTDQLGLCRKLTGAL
jgi:glycerophosphoryl diester phosphodiesterase